MVIIRVAFCLLLSFVAYNQSAIANDTRVALQLSDKGIFANQEIKGTITVQHLKSDKVYPNTFNIKGDPLQVKFVRNVEISPQSGLVISFYSFKLPAQKAGLHVLSGVNVKIAGRSYSTPAMTYEVKPRSKITKGPGGVILQLESFVDGNLPIYIGQEISVGYKIFFNGNIELTEQVLPLLDASGFKKVGNERIGDVREGSISVRQIEQKIEATKPGTFTFGPSYITGYTYTVDWRGKKKTMGGTIKAEAAPVTIVVMDFPKEGQPPSFNGSVGEDIDFDVSLITAALSTVGDKFVLSLVFSSSEDLSNVKLPEICCQPGFPGFFELDDIPPLPVERDGSMMYSLGLRPLTPNIREIPSIEFSYFNPDKEVYEIRRSKGIPVTVKPSPSKPLPLVPGTPTVPDAKTSRGSGQGDVLWPATTSDTQPIEIQTIYPLDIEDLSNTIFGTWAVFLILPFGGFFIYVQIDMREKRKKKAVAKNIKDSIYWFGEARNSKGDIGEFCHLLNKAFMMRLYEKGWIEDEHLSPQQLSDEGICKKVKSFLCGIEEMRFTSKALQSTDEIIVEADKLFYEIEKGVKHD